METFFFHQDIIIITANAAGEKYLTNSAENSPTSKVAG